jgi:hypothetical protein
VTPAETPGTTGTLDHPGGMQSDGKRLWIPIAESKPNSRSIIRVFRLAQMTPGQRLTPELEFGVNDHMGALAVSVEHHVVLGANWDTEKVYVWDLEGHPKQTLNGAELVKRGLGASNPFGIAVQDWKIKGDNLFVSGLCRESGPGTRRSRWSSFTHFLDSDLQAHRAELPLKEKIELGREAMAVSERSVYFLPEDLGATNRLFRVPLSELEKRVTIYGQ